MARIKLGAFITEITGSLGGNTFQKSSQGISMRKKPLSCIGTSSAQLNQRAYMLQVQRAWNNLSDAQRNAWKNIIGYYGAGSKKDSSIKLTGRELFIRWNCILLSAGYSIVISPDVSQVYTIDSDFSLYADDLSFIAVFDTDPNSQNKNFLLNMCRAGNAGYSPAPSSSKRIAALPLGSGGYDLRESFLNSHAILPEASQTVSGSIKQFSVLAPFVYPARKFLRTILPLSSLLSSFNFAQITSFLPETGVYAITKISNGVILAGTRGTGYIIRSVDNGLNWSNLGHVLPISYYRCFCEISPGVILASGNSNGIIGISYDYGLTWSILSSIPSVIAINFFLILNDSSILCGSRLNGGLYRSTDNGLTWIKINFDFQSTIIHSALICDDNSILIGCSTTGKIWRSVDNGFTYTDVSPSFGQTLITKLIKNSMGKIFATTGTNGLILSSIDNGLTWSSSDTLFSSDGFLDIICINDNLLLAGSNYKANIIYSSDYGISWHLLQSTPVDDSLVSLCYAGNGVILASTWNESKILRSNFFPNS